MISTDMTQPEEQRALNPQAPGASSGVGPKVCARPNDVETFSGKSVDAGASAVDLDAMLTRLLRSRKSWEYPEEVLGEGLSDDFYRQLIALCRRRNASGRSPRIYFVEQLLTIGLERG